MSKTKRSAITGKPVTTRIPSPAGGVRIETLIPWTLVKRGVRREVITPIETPAEFREELPRETQQRKLEQHSPLIRALGLAHYWQQLLDDGKFRSIREIAAAERMDVGRVSRLFRLTQLAPDRVALCLASEHTQAATSQRIPNVLPLDWQRQSIQG